MTRRENRPRPANPSRFFRGHGAGTVSVDGIIMRMLVRIAVAVLIGTSGAAGGQARLESSPLVAAFSEGRPGAELPAGWEPVRITPTKKPTRYRLVDDHGTVVLHARAEDAASGLGHDVVFDVRAAPIVEWRWKVDRLIDGADNTVAAREDSPARVVLEFDGERSRLSIRDRAFFALADRLSGRDMPYATLMYVWSNASPLGSVIANPNTGRVRMIVAASGAAGVGAWQTVRRNAYEDFRRAFGEEPGKLIAVGVLTDTDNTGATAEAWYGDIRFLPAN